MVVTWCITFQDNPLGCYSAGQLVSGTFSMKCDKAKDIKAILFKMHGFANTFWTERKFNVTEVFKGRVDYFAFNSYLMGSENDAKISLSTEEHTFAFSYQLPDNCPSSFEGSFGCIRYIVEVSLVRPWKYDHKFRRGITVLKMMELYKEPQMTTPPTSDVEHTFCCGPCRTQPIKIKLTIAKSSYVSGQNIAVQAVIINNTNLVVSKVRFFLIAVIRYTSQKPTRHRIQQVKICEVQVDDPVLNYSTRSLNQQIAVPATPPTMLNECSIIQIWYNIVVELKMKGWHLNKIAHVPVTIGVTPLATNNISDMNVVLKQPTSSNNLGKELSTDLNLNQEQEISPAILDLQTLTMALPTYEESVHMARININDGDKNAFGRCEFTPLYPVYNIQSPTLDEVPGPAGIDNRSFVA